MIRALLGVLSVIVTCNLNAYIVRALDPHDPQYAWMDEQIEKDFSAYAQGGITIDMLHATMNSAPRIAFGDNLERFQIIDNQIYGTKNYVGWMGFILNKLVSLYDIPDVDFIAHTQDIIWNQWLLSSPVFVTCRKTDVGSSAEIFFPIQHVREWEEAFVPTIESIESAACWENKIPKMCWRGWANDVNGCGSYASLIQSRRGFICDLSRQYPDVLDAAFSGYHAFTIAPHFRAEFNQLVQHPLSYDQYLQYKYLLDLDGLVASTPGYAWKLLTKSVVFKHESIYHLWYYSQLKPWVHYIPLKAGAEDVIEKIGWAVAHDEEAKQIAENSRTFVLNNMMPEHIYLYQYKVLKKYASLQKFTPEPLSDKLPLP